MAALLHFHLHLHPLLVFVAVFSSCLSVIVVPTGATPAEEVVVGGDDGSTGDCRVPLDATGTDGEGEEAKCVFVAGGASCRKEEDRHPTGGFDGPRAWRWDLDSPHRCDVRRISHRDLPKIFASTEGLVPKLYHEPIVIDFRHEYDNEEDDEHRYNAEFARVTSLDNITSQFDTGFEVILSSSNSFSQHRRTVTLEQYIRETISTETLPSDMSNETWYLFGETYTDPWVHLLNSYRLPPCQTCTRDLSALAFGIGNRGSGVQWHVHGPGFSESIHGRKHWVLYPPTERPDYDANFTSRHWMESVYTELPRRRLPRECTLHPGEMIYFPDGWYHATVNLDDYTAFVSSFTTEHL